MKRLTLGYARTSSGLNLQGYEVMTSEVMGRPDGSVNEKEISDDSPEFTAGWLVVTIVAQHVDNCSGAGRSEVFDGKYSSLSNTSGFNGHIPDTLKPEHIFSGVAALMKAESPGCAS